MKDSVLRVLEKEALTEKLAKNVGKKDLKSQHQDQFQIKDVKKDGNCLFRVFALHLFNDEEMHFVIRRENVEYTVKNWTVNYELLNSTCVNRVYKNAAEYELAMGKNAGYGTDFELGVFANIYKVDIDVYQLLDGKLVFKLPLRSAKNNYSKLKIVFSGEEQSGHWMLLESPTEVEENMYAEEAAEQLISKVTVPIVL